MLTSLTIFTISLRDIFLPTDKNFTCSKSPKFCTQTLLHMSSTFLSYDFEVIIRFAVVNFIERWNIRITDTWHISQVAFIQCPFNNLQCTSCFHGTRHLFVVGTAIVVVFPFIVVLIIMPFSPCFTTLTWFSHETKTGVTTLFSSTSLSTAMYCSLFHGSMYVFH